MAVQTTLNLPNAVKTFFDKLLLDRLEKKLWFAQFADKRPLPKNAGKTIEFTRYANLAAKTTALTEGVVQTTGDSQNLTASKLTATVDQYGGHIEVSDLFETTKIDPGLKEQVEILGYQAGLSIDTIIRNSLESSPTCSTEKFANDRADVDALVTGDILNASEVRKAATDLRKLDVMPFAGSDYMMIVHPVNVSDLQSDTTASGWLEAHKYDQPGNIFNGEIGKLYGVRFVETSNVKSATNTGTVDTYQTYMFGKHAYAMTELAGMGMKLIISPAKASVADPLAQVGTVGWKATFATACLNPDRIIKLVVGSAESPS